MQLSTLVGPGSSVSGVVLLLPLVGRSRVARSSLQQPASTATPGSIPDTDGRSSTTSRPSDGSTTRSVSQPSFRFAGSPSFRTRHGDTSSCGTSSSPRPAGFSTRACAAFASIWVAGAASLCSWRINPFYMRMILWDYTSLRGRCRAAVAGSGALVHRVHSGLIALDLRRLRGASRCGGLRQSAFSATVAVAAGAGRTDRRDSDAVRASSEDSACARSGRRSAYYLVFIGGYLGYRAYLGAYSPKRTDRGQRSSSCGRTTISAAPFQRPASEFLDGEPRIYAPVLLCLGNMVLAMGSTDTRRHAAGTARPVLGRVYSRLIWLYRFAVTSSVVETWWAYNMTAVSMVLRRAMVLDRVCANERVDASVTLV